MKIAILGTSGSGKSTLAKRLGEEIRPAGAPYGYRAFPARLGGAALRRGRSHCPAVSRRERRRLGHQTDNYSKTCYARRLKEADKIIVLWFSPLVCLWRAVRRWQQNKGRVRESSAPGCEEKIDAEFVRWILHDGRTTKKRAQMERIGEKVPGELYIDPEPAGAGWVLEGTLNWFSRRWRGSERGYAGLSSHFTCQKRTRNGSRACARGRALFH